MPEPPITGRPVGPAVQFQNVSVAYGDDIAVEGVTAALRLGTIVGLLGPNGAGKTTLLKALVGMLPLSGGTISVHGVSPREAWGHMAYLPQPEQVNWEFPVSVQDVVLAGRVKRLGWLASPRDGDRRMALAALARVGMADHAPHPIGRHSRGQRQRVLLARALVQEGDVLILDEPLADVDAVTQTAVVRLLGELRDQGVLVLLSMHDLSVATEVCDHLLCLNRRLIAFGKTRTVFIPEILRATYGATLAFVGGDLVVHDAHH